MMCIIGKCDPDALIRIVLLLGLKLSFPWIFLKISSERQCLLELVTVLEIVPLIRLDKL